MEIEQDPMKIDVVVDNLTKYLRIRDLLICRSVSKYWNEKASTVLRKRCTTVKRISDEKHLMKLKRCMKKSKNFPCVGLKFDQPWKFDSADAKDFFQSYGDRFTSLCLETWWNIRLNNLAPFIGHLTHLSTLEVGRRPRDSPHAVDCGARQDDGQILELPSVQIIRIAEPDYYYYDEVNAEVLREILEAASTLVQVECLGTSHGILGVLKSTGKIGATSSINIGLACSILQMDHYLPTGPLSLTKLEYTVWGDHTWNGLEKFLLYSHHTLKELHVDGISGDQCSWEKFPVLNKLTKLSLGVRSDGQLFHGEHGHKFPALRELKLDLLDWSRFSFRNHGANLPDLFIVPSVTTIDLKGYVNEDGMKELAKIFPSVIAMRLDYKNFSNEPQDPHAIWSVRNFNRLERLHIWNFKVKRQSKTYTHLDSFLTGIPAEICENLLKEEKLNLVDSPLNRILRVNPNLLQLSDLKELVVCVTAGSTKKLPEDRSPFISMLSVWHALEMMPNLRARFVYEDVSKPLKKDKLKKAMLEDAFKHVQDHVTLEPYFH